MRITRFIANNFRNFSHLEVKPGPGINVVFGENGSGKTSFLEGIYLFGFGRSFRPGGFRPLIKSGADEFTLFCEGHDASDVDSQQRFGMSRNVNGEHQLRINGSKEARLADLAKNVPVQLFTPESVEVIAGGPSTRRQLVDWGVFHVEHSFFGLWSNYNKVLRHRNKLLKTKRLNYSQAEDKYWVQQLCLYGQEITEQRQGYVERLGKYLKPIAQTFLPDVTLDVSLKVGWDSNKTLSDALSGSISNDVKYGHTSVGPHKADLQIIADGVAAKERLSRGQIKVLVASMKLAQARLLNEATGLACIIIVDDLTSELDRDNQRKFCELLEDSDNQVFISSVSIDSLSDNFKKEPAMFHVEHGILKRHIEN
ncbi:DNA replication/repair protein RecF [Idiomarina aquatica]|uniref:DNA replication and repair protein RecF n=1 Tax=Idiomarina aquatica TaxID=1327752 RepID=A0AA94EGX0_9GAMM|nr:DNA replication/repair protein RecF [Idiomarina aquatica]RUO45666.1 DNA replication/repair protein RecF [Idiomarina aquatica]